jgi:hypothetical protein
MRVQDQMHVVTFGITHIKNKRIAVISDKALFHLAFNCSRVNLPLRFAKYFTKTAR